MEQIGVRTNQQVEFVEITSQIQQWLSQQPAVSGVLTIFVPHTTAGIMINENADPDVIRDLTMELNKMVPFEDGYRHAEGNAAAHIKSTVLGSSVQVIIESGRLVLGTWQGIFFGEFDGPRTRKIQLQLVKSG